MSRLVLLGGPPGIGKSTTIKDPLLNHYTCLDAEQIWPPGRSGEHSEAVSTVVSAVDGELSDGRDVIITWVFARAALYQPFLDRFAPIVQVQQIYLVCEPLVLQKRLLARNTPDLLAYALGKLDLIDALPFDKIDTTGMKASDVAKALCDAIQHDT